MFCKSSVGEKYKTRKSVATEQQDLVCYDIKLVLLAEAQVSEHASAESASLQPDPSQHFKCCKSDMSILFILREHWM